MQIYFKTKIKKEKSLNNLYQKKIIIPTITVNSNLTKIYVCSCFVRELSFLSCFQVNTILLLNFKILVQIFGNALTQYTEWRGPMCLACPHGTVG